MKRRCALVGVWLLMVWVARGGSIAGYDGIALGADMATVRAQLEKLPGVDRLDDGTAVLERVPGKSYYRYRLTRTISGGGQSEVKVLFRRGRVCLLQDVFGGSWHRDSSEAGALFMRLAQRLTRVWGEPIHRAERMVTWKDDCGEAVLFWPPRDGPEALDIVKLTVSGEGQRAATE